MEGYHLTNYYYGKVKCEICTYRLPKEKKIGYSISKRVKSGFICVGCALEKHLITDKEVIDFLKDVIPEITFRYRPKREIVRY